MKNLFYLFTVLVTALVLTSCGGSKKQEKLTDPQINAKIGVEIGHIDRITSLALSPVGHRVAVADYNKSLIVWDYDTKHQIWAYRVKSNRALSDIRSVFYTSDGTKLVTGSDDQVDIFDAEKGSVIKTIEVKGCNGDKLTLTADDKFAAVTSKGYSISILDVNAGSVVKKLEGHTLMIRSLAFSADGKYLASSAVDSTVIIWDVEKGKIAKKIDTKQIVGTVAISSKANKFVFSIRGLKELYVWDLQKMKSIKTMKDVAASKLIFNGDKLFTREYSNVKEIDLKDYKVIKSIEDHGWCLSVVGDKFATTGGRKGIRVYNLDDYKMISEFGRNTLAVKDIEVSPSGRFIVADFGEYISDVLSYSIDTSYTFTAYKTSGDGVSNFAFEGEKDVVFLEKSYGESYYYDLKTGKELKEVKDKVTDPYCITKDGKFLFAKDSKNKDNFGIYDVQTGNLKTKILTSSKHVNFAALTPDSRYYVLNLSGHTKIFAAASGKELKSFASPKMSGIKLLDSDKEGNPIVGRNNFGFTVLKILTDDVLFNVKDIKANDAALHKDKNTLAVACDDGTVKVFDMAKNTQIHTLQHAGYLRSVAYTPDGKYLISSAQDGKMNIWDLQGKLLLTIVGIRKDYGGETKDYLVFAPNGRYDGTEAAIERCLYFEENGQKKPAKDFKDQCYTPNLLGLTLGQNFVEEAKEK